MKSTLLACACRIARAFLVSLSTAATLQATAWANNDTHTAASPQDVASRLAVLMQQPVGGDTARAMAWVQYLMRERLDREADDLFRAVVDDYFAPEGREMPERVGETVGSAVQRGKYLPGPIDDQVLRQRLAQVMHRQLVLAPIARSAGAAPTMGADSEATHELQNRGPRLLVLQRFSAFQRNPSGANEEIRCAFTSRNGPQAIAALESRKVQCVAAAAADSQRQGQTFRPAGSPDFAPTAQEQPYEAQRMLLHLAPLRADAVRAFQRTHAPCGLHQVCNSVATQALTSQPAAVSATTTATATAMAMAATGGTATASSEADRSRGGSGKLYNQIKGLLVLIALFPVYALVAYRKGTRAATRAFTALSFLGGLAVIGSVFGRPWLTSGTLGWGVAMGAVGVAAFTLAGYVFSRSLASVFDAFFGNRLAATRATQQDAGLASRLR